MKLILPLITVASTTLVFSACDSKQEEARKEALENRADALEDKADSTKKHSVGTPCKDCGNKFPEEQLLMHNGDKICEGCLAKRREKQRENSRKFRAQAYADEKSHTLHVQIGAGVAAIVVAGLIWYFSTH